MQSAMISQSIDQTSKEIKNTINSIKQTDLSISDELVLVRSVLEKDAMLNFILAKDAAYRTELFVSYSKLEWFSHVTRRKHINIDLTINLLERLFNDYPNGFIKYFNLIKRRVCKELLREIDSTNDYSSKYNVQRKLNIVNSDRAKDNSKRLRIIARYMLKHPLDKLPFPYRIVLGKSITHLVLNYSPVDKETYWFLTDASHGILFNNDFDMHIFDDRIHQLLRKIDTRI